MPGRRHKLFLLIVLSISSLLEPDCLGRGRGVNRTCRRAAQQLTSIRKPGNARLNL
jgi:hypothetical protein